MERYDRAERAWKRIEAALELFRPDGRLNDRAWATGEIAAAVKELGGPECGAEKALRCPLDPDLRLRLYVYWGDAIILTDVTRPIPESRAAAAAVYLQGLKEAKQYNIPDVPPERPAIFLPKPRMDEKTFKREREAHFKELKRIDYVRTLYEDRVVLQRQLLDDYSRRPLAPDELRKLATMVLGEGPDVDKLMAALAAKCGQKRGQN